MENGHSLKARASWLVQPKSDLGCAGYDRFAFQDRASRVLGQPPATDGKRGCEQHLGGLPEREFGTPLFEDESPSAVLSRQRFRLIVRPTRARRFRIMSAISWTSHAAAFVKFGKGNLRFVWTTECYRWANRSPVTLGIGSSQSDLGGCGHQPNERTRLTGSRKAIRKAARARPVGPSSSPRCPEFERRLSSSLPDLL